MSTAGRPGYLYADKMTDSLNMRWRDQPPARESSRPITPPTASPRNRSRTGLDVMHRSTRRDHVTVDTGVIGDMHRVGYNLKATIADLDKKMREAAAPIWVRGSGEVPRRVTRLEASIWIPAATPAEQIAAGLTSRPAVCSTAGEARQPSKFKIGTGSGGDTVTIYLLQTYN